MKCFSLMVLCCVLGIILGVAVCFKSDMRRKVEAAGFSYSSPPEDPLSNASSGFVSTDVGMMLYGKVHFDCGDGDLACVMDSNYFEIIPRGAVLVVIRPYYTIGYYEGKITISDNGKKTSIGKIFFVIHKNGNIDYHYPSPNSKLPGEVINGKVTFK